MLGINIQLGRQQNAYTESFAYGEYFSPCHRLASGRCSTAKMRTYTPEIYDPRGVSLSANIFRLATASRAGVALRRKCEPLFASLATRGGSLCPPKKDRVRRWRTLSFFGGPEGSRTPVRKPLDMTFSECIPLIMLPRLGSQRTSRRFG